MRRSAGVWSNAAVENGSRRSTTSKRVPGGPSWAGSTWATRSRRFSSAVFTAFALARSGTITFVSPERPLGNERARISAPSTDSTSPRNELLLVRPVSICVTPSASTTSSSVPLIQIGRGRDATRSPIRRQRPWVSSVPIWPTCGIVSKNGDQNALRPQITSSAGSIVSIEIIAIPTPMAPIGPRPAVPLTSARLSVSNARITVIPEARMAGPAVRSATRIASCLSSWRRNSSRYRLTSSNA